ncbi:MAG: acyl-CoA dehydrogenase family protein [Burkholderiaceae bacterium]|nr:acyl-CoA dehydrogenase family protein [Burkholderiaceae bacterium]
MDFTLSEEEQLLADSVNRLIEKDYGFERRMAITRTDEGYSPEVWGAIAEMGLLGLPLAEADGGFGAGTTGMISVMAAMGTGLVVEPYVSTLICARLVAAGGADPVRGEVLEAVVGGECKLALAHGERDSRYRLSSVTTSAKRAGDNWVLDGEKSLVVHAPMADRLLVSARTAGRPDDEDGISLFLVDAQAKGLQMKTLRTVDNLRAADLSLSGVKVSDSCRIGEAGAAYALLDEAADFGSLLYCAEAVGVMNDANAMTLEYLKTRKQFGAPIGSFQALQHRMVDMTVSAFQSKSIVLLACSRFDDASAGKLSAGERRRAVSAAKIKVADAARQVGQEAIQLHGGMGMTQEMKVSHSFKRLTMLAQVFGDADHHLARFAREDAALYEAG